MELSGKQVDMKSIQIEGLKMWDYPDFCDAFIAFARFTDGTPLNEKECYELTATGIVNELIHNGALYL